MYFKIFILNIFFLLANLSLTLAESGTIDTIIFYRQGIAEAEYINNPNFPSNIFGIPTPTATNTLPAINPKEIEAIGIGGEIIVGFKNKVLYNGPGSDFIIFENSFINPVNKGIFAEPGVVSVSQNGVDFLEFPFNPTTLEGLAGKSPTNGNKDPFNPSVSGGDAFDLQILGLDYIKYIRIKDTTNLIKSLPAGDKYKNPDFLLTGFDLDAVVGLYLEDEPTVSVLTTPELYIYKQTIDEIMIQSIDGIEIDCQVFDLNGNRHYSSISVQHNIGLNRLASGIYFAFLQIGNTKKSIKFVVN